MSSKETILSPNELKILKLRLLGLTNKEIALKLDVSQEYISQAVGSVKRKIRKVEDSIALFEELEVIQRAPRFRLTKQGKEMIIERRARRSPFITMVLAKKGKYINDGRILSELDYPNSFFGDQTIDLSKDLQEIHWGGGHYHLISLKRLKMSDMIEEVS